MFRKILVPLDRSGLAEQALGPAASMARHAGASMELVFVHHDVNLRTLKVQTWDAEHVVSAEHYLQEVGIDLAAGASVEVDTAVLHGEPAEQICTRARATCADLIVLTSHGRTGISRMWFGSVAGEIIRRADAPVLVLHPVAGLSSQRRAEHPIPSLLVPFDGSPMAAEIIPATLDLASCCGASVTILRVVNPVPLVVDGLISDYGMPPLIPDDEATDRLARRAKEELGELIGTLRKESPCQIDAAVIIAASVGQGIVDFAQAHDVGAVAMTTHGRGASRLLLGSVADKILRSLGRPVLIGRPLARRASPSQPAEAATADVRV